jgi:hypothetical protein
VPVLLALVVILGGAKLGGEVFERIGQPAVMGELAAGVILGNLVLLNPSWTFLKPLRAEAPVAPWAAVVDSLSRIGVILTRRSTSAGNTALYNSSPSHRTHTDQIFLWTSIPTSICFPLANFSRAFVMDDLLLFIDDRRLERSLLGGLHVKQTLPALMRFSQP